MPKVPGSGRKAGTPNKKSAPLEEMADQLGIHPFKILLLFAGGRWQELGYQAETFTKYNQYGDHEEHYIKPEVRMKAAAEAASYLYAKKKEIEIIGELDPKPHVKSFEDFCVSADYPKPFPKQIEMMHFGMNKEGSRLLLGSRGYGKTDYVTVLGIAYQIYLDKEFTSLIVTKSKTRNSAMLSEIAKALEKNGLSLEKNNSEAVRISGMVGKDHSVSATTVKSVSLRGRHPNLIVMDDPVTPDDISEATRMQVERTYNEICKLTSNVVVIGQPVHQYDLFEKLRPLIQKMEVPFGSIPELDPDLEAMKLAGVDEASIQASYYLKLTSLGGNPFDKIRYTDSFPAGDSAVAFIDPSFEGGDYTAMTILKKYMDGVAVQGYAWKKAWHHCFDDMLPHLIKTNVHRLAFETNSLGEMPLKMLREAFGDKIGIVGRKSNTNKHSRIMAAATYAHLIHLSKQSDKTYIDHVVKYEYKSKYDDAPDSLASCLEWVGLIRGKT